MPAGTWTLTSAGRRSLIDGTFDVDSDSFKVGLYQSTSNIGAASTTIAGVTNEVAAGTNGYTAGGIAVALNITGAPNPAVAFTVNPVWTVPNGGANLVARWAVLYEVGGNVLAYCLLDTTPADVVTTAGNTLTIDSDGTPSPVFTLA